MKLRMITAIAVGVGLGVLSSPRQVTLEWEGRGDASLLCIDGRCGYATAVPQGDRWQTTVRLSRGRHEVAVRLCNSEGCSEPATVTVPWF